MVRNIKNIAHLLKLLFYLFFFIKSDQVLNKITIYIVRKYFMYKNKKYFYGGESIENRKIAHLRTFRRKTLEKLMKSNVYQVRKVVWVLRTFAHFLQYCAPNVFL